MNQPTEYRMHPLAAEVQRLLLELETTRAVFRSLQQTMREAIATAAEVEHDTDQERVTTYEATWTATFYERLKRDANRPAPNAMEPKVRAIRHTA